MTSPNHHPALVQQARQLRRDWDRPWGIRGGDPLVDRLCKFINECMTVIDAVAGQPAPHLASAERERLIAGAAKTQMVLNEQAARAQFIANVRRLLTSGPIGGVSGERYIRADLIRAVLDKYEGP